jgi:hypothetical protein
MSKINRSPKDRAPAWEGLLSEFGKMIANLREATDETIKAQSIMKVEVREILDHARASADQATKVGRQLMAVFPKLEVRVTKTEERLDEINGRAERTEARVEDLHRRVSVVESRGDVTKRIPL